MSGKPLNGIILWARPRVGVAWSSVELYPVDRLDGRPISRLVRTLPQSSWRPAHDGYKEIFCKRERKSTPQAGINGLTLTCGRTGLWEETGRMADLRGNHIPDPCPVT